MHNLIDPVSNLIGSVPKLLAQDLLCMRIGFSPHVPTMGKTKLIDLQSNNWTVEDGSQLGSFPLFD
jgi:hypothetical protein